MMDISLVKKGGTSLRHFSHTVTYKRSIEKRRERVMERQRGERREVGELGQIVWCKVERVYGVATIRPLLQKSPIKKTRFCKRNRIISDTAGERVCVCSVYVLCMCM